TKIYSNAVDAQFTNPQTAALLAEASAQAASSATARLDWQDFLKRAWADPALAQAVEAVRAAASSAVDGELDRAGRLRSVAEVRRIASALKDALSNDPTVLDVCIRLMQRYAEALPGHHPERVGLLDASARGLRILFRRTGDADTLQEAITLARGVTASTPDSDPHAAAHLDTLSRSLRPLFEFTGDLDALTEAVTANRRAVRAAADGSTEHTAALS